MAVFVFLLLWNVGWTTAATDQPRYPIPPVAVNIDAKEPKTPMTLPRLSTGYSIAQRGAKFMVHLFSGKAEFPFVMKIKANDYAPCEDPADAIYREAAGMLITSEVVMTACRPVSYLSCKDNISNTEEWPNDNDPLPNPIGIQVPIFPGSDKVNLKKFLCPPGSLSIMPMAPHTLDVRYATLYLDEENKYADRFGRYIRDRRELFCGMRHIYDVILHPDCRPWLTLENDVALLFMTASIFPGGNWIGFPTFALNRHGFVDITDLSSDDLICYISGFNNDYAGMLGDDQITRNYKVKFRAYQTTIETCKSYIKIICFDKELALMRGCWFWLRKYSTMNAAQIKAAGIECWETRHKIGAVCDIHTGGPLVCGGITHGFVLRGADWHRCNNLYRMPFFVTRIHPFQPFFDLLDLQRVLPYNPIVIGPDERPEPSHDVRGRASHQSENGLLLLMWILLYVSTCTFKF